MEGIQNEYYMNTKIMKPQTTLPPCPPALRSITAALFGSMWRKRNYETLYYMLSLLPWLDSNQRPMSLPTELHGKPFGASSPSGANPSLSALLRSSLMPSEANQDSHLLPSS